MNHSDKENKSDVSGVKELLNNNGFESRMIEIDQVIGKADQLAVLVVIAIVLVVSLVTIRILLGDCIQIVIADNGDPIAEEIAEHIFEPFVTGDKSRNTRSGSGLGLSIAKKIVTMHGGDLVLEQKINAEYTKAFVITLPI